MSQIPPDPSSPRISSLSLAGKRTVDIVFSLLAMALLALPLAVIAVAILLDTGRPVLFRQERLGKDLRVFKMLKFRTMVVGAQDTGTGLFSYRDGPRVTGTGRLLRLLSLDELPQLVNIIRGDMSLVGPRPPVVGELGETAEFTAATLRRFSMRPGVTGLAQATGRNEFSWDTKIILDNQYLDGFARQGLWLDLRIIARTVVVVLSRKGVVESESE